MGYVETSLAILKVNWDSRGHDYIENFVPFVLEALRTSPRPEISLPQIQESLESEFGLIIPLGALKTILRRVVRRGFAQIEHGIYSRNDSKIGTTDMPQLRDQAMAEFKALARSYVTFVADRFSVQHSEDDALAALDTYVQVWSSAMLTRLLGEPPGMPSGSTDYVTSAFIEHIYLNEPRAFSHLETLVKGTLLANVVYYPDWQNVNRRFRSTRVFFDTTFLLRALGFEGPSLQAPNLELLNLLYDAGADLRCFEHTRQEMRGVLLASAATLAVPVSQRYITGHHETFEYFIKQGFKPSDIALLAENLRSILEAQRVTIEEKPDYNPRLVIDETRLEQVISAEYHGGRREAILHDVDCLSAIFRLRKGRFADDVETCRAIFVTTNVALERASRQFFADGYGIGPSRIGVCILDYPLTTMMWLKAPLRAPDLPRHRIVADCYIALNPPDDIWRRYLDEVNRLKARGSVSDDDYFILRFSLEARTELMDTTRGDLDAFAEGTVVEVLERARNTIRRDAEERAEDEEAQRVELESQVGKYKSALDEERSRSDAERRADRDKVTARAFRIGHWLSRAVGLVVLILLGLGAWIALPEDFPNLKLPGVLPAIVLVLLLFWTLANLVFGVTVGRFVRIIEVRLGLYAEQLLFKLIGQNATKSQPAPPDEPQGTERRV